MIDTHAHIFTEDFSEDLNEVIERAKNVGVEKILLPNIDKNSIEALRKASEKYPSILIPMMGLHPTSVADDWESQLEIIEKELNLNKYIAVGEIGIDLHWDKSTYDIQRLAFERQLKWSVEKGLPVSIHSRNALIEVIESIKAVDKKNIYGVFHSFGGNSEELTKALELENMYIGINGVVTFKNSGLDKILADCPIDRVVIETDSPWLAPVPYRGKRNESSFLIEVVKKLSLIYNLPENEIIKTTRQNSHKVFNI